MDRGVILTSPPKSGVRSFRQPLWEKVIRILGKGEVLFSSADADTWPCLIPPRSCQPQYKHSRLYQNSGCLGAKGGKPFHSCWFSPTLKANSLRAKQRAGWEEFCLNPPTPPPRPCPAQTQNPAASGFLCRDVFIFRMGLPRSPKCGHTGDRVSFLVGNGSGWVTEAGSDAGREGKGGTRLHSSRL